MRPCWPATPFAKSAVIARSEAVSTSKTFFRLYCQDRKGVNVERLDRFDDQEDHWQEAVVKDTRNARCREIVAFRVDFADWLKSLKRRDRRIAEFLSLGNRTKDAAKSSA